VLRDHGHYYETRARLDLALPIRLEITLGLERERSAVDRLRDPSIQLGAKEFDSIFIVRGEPVDEVRAFLTEPVRAALIAVAKLVDGLELRPGHLEVFVTRTISDYEELTTLFDSIATVARTLARELHRRAYR
jgi:hypothetical protein